MRGRRRRPRIARIRHVTHFWECSQGASVKLVILTPYKGASFIAFASESDPVYDGTLNGFGTNLLFARKD